MEFLELFLGCKSVYFYTAAIMFILLGFATNKILSFKNRTNKDIRFSFRYWLRDNLLDVLLAFILSFISIRFTDDLLSYANTYFNFDTSKISDNMLYYYLIGLTHQTLLHLARKRLSFMRSRVLADGESRK